MNIWTKLRSIHNFDGKVMSFPKLVGFILWVSWMSLSKPSDGNPVDVKIYQFGGPTDQLTDGYCHPWATLLVASAAKKNIPKIICFATFKWAWNTNIGFVFPHITWLKQYLFLLCFSGFVELNHMLTSCYPPLSANSASGPQRLLQKPRRESAMTESRTPLFGCTKTLELRENLYQPG